VQASQARLGKRWDKGKKERPDDRTLALTKQARVLMHAESDHFEHRGLLRSRAQFVFQSCDHNEPSE